MGIRDDIIKGIYLKFYTDNKLELRNGTEYYITITTFYNLLNDEFKIK